MANRRVISMRHLENLRFNPVGVSVFDQTGRIDLQQKWGSHSRKCNLRGNYSVTVFFIFTTHQRSCGKLKFSVVHVCLCWGGLMWPSPMMYWTSLYIDPNPLTPALSLGHETSLYTDPSGPTPWTWGITLQAPPASDIWWQRLDTCSNMFTWGLPRPVLTSSGGPHPTGILPCLLKNCADILGDTGD